MTEKELYNYVAHDPERFAIHEIHDSEYQLELRNEFFKLSPDTSEDWVSQVSNTNSMNGDSTLVSAVYSFALEKLNSTRADLRKFTLAEDGSSIRIDVNNLDTETNYIYISLMVEGQLVSLPGNPNFGITLIN